MSAEALADDEARAEQQADLHTVEAVVADLEAVEADLQNQPAGKKKTELKAAAKELWEVVPEQIGQLRTLDEWAKFLKDRYGHGSALTVTSANKRVRSGFTSRSLHADLKQIDLVIVAKEIPGSAEHPPRKVFGIVHKNDVRKSGGKRVEPQAVYKKQSYHLTAEQTAAKADAETLDLQTKHLITSGVKAFRELDKHVDLSGLKTEGDEPTLPLKDEAILEELAGMGVITQETREEMQIPISAVVIAMLLKKHKFQEQSSGAKRQETDFFFNGKRELAIGAIEKAKRIFIEDRKKSSKPAL